MTAHMTPCLYDPSVSDCHWCANTLAATTNTITLKENTTMATTTAVKGPEATAKVREDVREIEKTVKEFKAVQRVTLDLSVDEAGYLYDLLYNHVAGSAINGDWDEVNDRAVPGVLAGIVPALQKAGVLRKRLTNSNKWEYDKRGYNFQVAILDNPKS